MCLQLEGQNQKEEREGLKMKNRDTDGRREWTDKKHQDNKWSNQFTKRQSNSQSETGLKGESTGSNPEKIRGEGEDNIEAVPMSLMDMHPVFGYLQPRQKKLLAHRTVGLL